MAEITIRHDHQDGTLVEGMERGDGTYEIICARYSGFKWFRSLGTAGIPHSRDRVAKRWVINAVAEKLRAAGHIVEVVIDDEHRDRATVLADQAERLDDRAEALAAKAERRVAETEALWAYSDRLVEHIPPGQPILVGHHSERGHRRTLERAQNAAFKALETGAKAKETTRRAAAVGSAAAYSATPAVTARRIETAEVELRDIDRKMNGYTRRSLDGRGQPLYVETHDPASGEWREQLLARKSQLEDQVAYDREALAAAVAEGRYKVYDRTTVHVGDLVSRGCGWHEVVRVNKVSVSVKTGYSWTDTVRYTDIRGVRCEHGQAQPDATS